MKKVRIICILLVVSVLFSGCSVTALNDTLKDVTQAKNNQDVVSQTIIGKYVESDAGSNSDNEKGEGGSFDAAIEIEKEDGTKETIGTKGLTYTYNSMKVYGDFFESGLDLRANMMEYDFQKGEFYLWDQHENILKNNMFILVDITATYHSPENGKKEINVDVHDDIIGYFKDEKMPEGWMDEFVALKKNGINVVDVQVRYFSIAPLPEDAINPDHDEMFMLSLKDGESKTFQIGICCWEKFVEYKNVYLKIENLNSNTIEGYDGRYFALFPEE